MTCKIYLYERFFTVFNAIGYLFFTGFLYVGYMWLSTTLPYSRTYGTIEVLFSSPQFYLVCILVLSITYIGDYFMKIYNFYILTSCNDYCREWTNQWKNAYPQGESLMAANDLQEKQRLWEKKEVELSKVALAVKEKGEKQILIDRNKKLLCQRKKKTE